MSEIAKNCHISALKIRLSPSQIYTTKWQIFRPHPSPRVAYFLHRPLIILYGRTAPRIFMKLHIETSVYVKETRSAACKKIIIIQVWKKYKKLWTLEPSYDFLNLHFLVTFALDANNKVSLFLIGTSPLRKAS